MVGEVRGRPETVGSSSDNSSVADAGKSKIDVIVVRKIRFLCQKKVLTHRSFCGPLVEDHRELWVKFGENTVESPFRIVLLML